MLKRILHVFVLVITTIGFAYGDTQTIDWYVDGSVYNTTTCTVGGDVNLPTAPTKYGYTFRGWYNYIPLEYIQGTTNLQYIDTGIIPNPNMNIYTKIQFMSVAQEYNGNTVDLITGCRNANQSAGDGFAFFINPTSFTLDFFDHNRYQSDIQRFDNDIYELNIENFVGTVKQNSNIIGTHTFNPTQTVSCTLLINASHLGTSLLSSGNIVNRIYRFTINGVIDLIPVLDYNGVPCMFDKVSETFFYNAGTGSFTAGPVISNQ